MRNPFSMIAGEFRHFASYPKNMKVLLMTNMIYSLVLPVIELFISAYIMRNSSDVIYVMTFILAQYTGVPITFFINGFLLRKVKITYLYSFGMLLSGISMAYMMSLGDLNVSGVLISGLIMGISTGFFWSNRDFLALCCTEDSNRNYYYGLETFFNTTSSVIIPYTVGAFIGAAESECLPFDVNTAYHIVTIIVFILTIIASCIIWKGNFSRPVNEPFVHICKEKMWNNLRLMAILKGAAQGYVATAPAMLIMTLVGNEGTLGLVQSLGAILSAILLYILGRVTKPEHRVAVFSIGLILFAVGSFFNAMMYSAAGVILFMICFVLSRPLMDMGYFPIMLNVMDRMQQKEHRSSYTYIFSHEVNLYVGRLIGYVSFIVFCISISSDLALRYMLLIVGIMQMLSIFIAKAIDKELKK